MTPQERAAELCFKLALLVDAGTHMDVDTDAMKAIADALTATRRAALLEARQAVSKLFDQQASELPDYYAALLDAGSAIDRLAQEG